MVVSNDLARHRTIFGITNYYKIVSLAVRFRDYDGCGNLSSYMLTLNPIMGHLGAVHTASAGRDLMMAVRYEFNMFSFDSDIAFGLHYAPEDKQQALKLRLGIRQVHIILPKIVCTRISN